MILLLLVAGAIVNVAVAWGLAAAMSIYDPRKPPSPSEGFVQIWRPRPKVGGWALSSESAFGSVRYRASAIAVRLNLQEENDWVRSLYPTWIDWPKMLDERAITWMKQRSGYLQMMVDARGWPMLSMRSLWDSTAPSSGQWLGAIALPANPPAGWPGQFSIHYQRALPLTPIWPGFAINTVFYAGVLWLLFAAPFALRRRRRIKRGLCPKCAYPVGTNERCTECGTTHAVKP